MVPSTLTGQRGEDIPMQHRGATGVALPDRQRRAVHTQRRDASAGKLGHQPAGTAAHVDRRPGAAVQQPDILVVGRAQPALRGNRKDPPIVTDELGGPPGQRRIED
jgi:hypothetical protein